MAMKFISRALNTKYVSAFGEITAQTNNCLFRQVRLCSGKPIQVPKEFEEPAEDTVEGATGLEKKQLIALLHGDDRFEPKIYKRGPGTRDQPNIVPILDCESRMVGCVCEPDQCYINYMMINLGEVKRCECGYWFKSVVSEPDVF